MEERIYKHALSHKVLAVAVVHYFNNVLVDWAVYIDAVAGNDHDYEKHLVALNGGKIHLKIAQVLFPDFDIKKYRH